MKKTITVGLMLIMIMATAGCFAGKMTFNQTYLPGADADKPAIKVVFSNDVNDDIAGYNRKAKLANNIELSWTAPDKLYLHLENSSVYIINPATGDMSRLADDERKEAADLITKKVNITNTAANSGLVKKVMSYVLSTFGQQYTGELHDHGNIFEIYAAVEMQRGTDSSEKSCESARLKAKLTNFQAKEMNLQWPYPCDWTPQTISNYKVPQILRKLHISPSGKYILFEGNLYRFGKEQVEAQLLSTYSGVVSIAVRPDWSSIAILKKSGNKHWVEFFTLKNLD